MSRFQPSYFSALMGESETPAIMSGPDGRVLEANNAARALLGAAAQPGALWPCPAARNWPAAALLNGMRLWLAADEREAKTNKNFLLEASHEIRTPLNGILGMTGLLLETPMSPAQAEYASAVREQASSLLNLLNSMLDYARLESARPTLERTAFDPVSLMQSVAELMSPRAYEFGLEIATVAGRDVPPLVLGDEARVRQILLNLTNSAIKCADAQGVVLSARVLSREGDNIRVRFEVRAPTAKPVASGHEGDLESGFGAAIVNRLADVMGGASEARHEEGRGWNHVIDLPFLCGGAKGAPYPSLDNLTVVIASASSVLSEAIASTMHHAGAIPVAATTPEAVRAILGEGPAVILLDRSLAADNAQSFLALGAPVIVMAPQEARGEIAQFLASGCAGFLVKPLRRRSLLERVAIAAKVEGRAAAPLRAGGALNPVADERETGPVIKAKILLAEDNPVNARIATAMLSAEGHEVHWAEDGEAALAALETKSFDMAILDMRMPKMDGRATARAIRAKGGRYTRMPILALTAEAFIEDAANALAAGVNEVLCKPVDRRVLGDTVARWMRQVQLA